MNPESYDQMVARWQGEARARRWNPLRMVAVFAVVFFSLQWGWEACRGTALERALIDTATVAPAAWSISHLWPGYGVTAQSNSIVSPAGKINVLNGCEGLELMFLLAAAFLAYPMSWRQRTTGIALGFLLAYVANQVRLTALWYAYVHDRDLFGLLHGIVAPLILVAVCLVYFTVFISRNAVRTA
jgi:exosortase/archaeosortase family protein